jgi:prepilin-type N-terminal cleavage/methylation domain-containing protein
MRIITPVRRGFTLVEMLVAMALTVFIMAILSQAFVAGLDTFRGLKAMGDMQQTLRVGINSLRSDLSADHFEGKRKLSDPDITSNPPKQGYVFIRQANPTKKTGPTTYNPPSSIFEGVDADGLPSQRAANHVLAMTIKLRGNQREHYLISRDIPIGAGPQWSPLSLPGVAAWANVTDASMATPIEITSNNHGQQTGAKVIVLGVQGNTAANGVWTITVGGDPNKFQLNGSSGNAKYTGGGVWSASLHERDGLFNGGGPFPGPLASWPFQPPVPPNPDTYSSQWAEVAYYLVMTGTTDEPDNPASTTGVPLFSLYRSQYLLVPHNAHANSTTDGTTNSPLLTSQGYYSGISCFDLNGKTLYFNSPGDVADTTDNTPQPPGPPAPQPNPPVPNAPSYKITAGMQRRVLAFHNTAATMPLGTLQRSSTLVMSNVVSFNAQVLYPGASDFSDLLPLIIPVGITVPNATTNDANNPNAWFLPMYDTTVPTSPLSALKISIRVFDSVTKQARQISLVQDM